MTAPEAIDANSKAVAAPAPRPMSTICIIELSRSFERLETDLSSVPTIGARDDPGRLDFIRHAARPRGDASVPIPKFVSPRGRLLYELRNQRDTSYSMV